jgi:hypothetical protein
MGICVQSGVKRGQEEHDKDRLVLGFDQGPRGEGCGPVVVAGVLVFPFVACHERAWQLRERGRAGVARVASRGRSGLCGVLDSCRYR